MVLTVTLRARCYYRLIDEQSLSLVPSFLASVGFSPHSPDPLDTIYARCYTLDGRVPALRQWGRQKQELPECATPLQHLSRNLLVVLNLLIVWRHR